MTNDTRPARAAACADPDRNPQFSRRWCADDVVTGAEEPQEPGHGFVWHASACDPLAFAASHRQAARKAAEAVFRRGTR